MKNSTGNPNCASCPNFRIRTSSARFWKAFRLASTWWDAMEEFYSGIRAPRRSPATCGTKRWDDPAARMFLLIATTIPACSAVPVALSPALCTKESRARARFTFGIRKATGFPFTCGLWLFVIPTAPSSERQKVSTRSVWFQRWTTPRAIWQLTIASMLAAVP